ncbi:TfoX/Sxy family protein [Planomonospora sp. ID67723]|uniref:TfoX/Sxy family protein n=1 Tax=Planomonospora sp. ID67723 TaxID=2738134 RepID=UPI0018C43C23|nr:TfoX/Sxy family protein [Planomonospora sp. ID67723]MBG0831472.1 TfoX/Sxy family protein [Planomonospora sp. ID67723]
MTGSRTIADHVLDLLGSSSGVDLACFFGGWSLRRDGKQIGIVMDTVYAKVDPAHRDAWHATGSTPFRYTARGRMITVEAYWSLPADALDDPDLLRDLLTTDGGPTMPPDRPGVSSEPRGPAP